MKHQQPEWDVPTAGDALLITPKRNADNSDLIALAMLSLADVLRFEPTTHLFRFEGGKKGLVFTEPAPRALVELLVKLLHATEEPVRLEELKGLRPVVRISRQGIRVYVTEEEAGADVTRERRRPGFVH